MKTQFRAALFERIKGELMGVTGKQARIAESMGVKQCDVSMIKRGLVDRFSTDKLIDIAEKCGHSFDFTLKAIDRSTIDSAKATGKTDMQKDLERITANFDDLGWD